MKIPNSITQKLGRQILQAQKASPKWLFAAGIIGVVGSTVLACRATLKLENKLDAFNDDVESHKADAEELDLSKSEYRKTLGYIYAKNCGSIAKLYAPAIILGGASIAALTGSHVILTNRNTAVMAAYGALQTSFDQYISRVKEELGEEKERDIRNGIVKEKVKVDGKTELVSIRQLGRGSEYARLFDEYNKNWCKNPENNKHFIMCQQSYFNDLLHSRGHVFLNEVYDALGIDRSTAGQAVGWVITPDRCGGDNYIDFGIFDVFNGNIYVNAGFIAGIEPSILLDFNVDGVIWDKI